ncbi:MAG: S1C family serine protease [Acidimicrobiales bacterium]
MSENQDLGPQEGAAEPTGEVAFQAIPVPTENRQEPPGAPAQGPYLPPPTPGHEPPRWSQDPWYVPPGAHVWGSGPPTQLGPTHFGRSAVSNRRKLPLVLAALLLAGAGVLAGHGLWSNQGSNQTPSALAPQGSTSRAPVTGRANAAATGSISARVSPALVDVNTTLGYQQAQAAGTGMVLTSNGEVLTNNHVIDGATTISVTDIGSGRTYQADVLGYDMSHDVALIQMRDASGLATIDPGDSSNLAVGDSVVAIGNAGGAGGAPSVASGSVTALNQSITAGDQSGAQSEQLNGLIESDAAIQPGDSGGPLVDSGGKVVGMDTAASSDFQLQGGAYSIPIDTALSIAHAIEGGNSTSSVHIGATAFLGVQVEGSNGSQGAFPGSFGTPSTGPGVYVAQVVNGGPADGAGLAAGDAITKLAGSSVSTPVQVTEALFSHHPGDHVEISWTDASGASHQATVQLASGPPQ